MENSTFNYIGQTIGCFLDNISVKYPDNEAIVFPQKNQRYTYKQFINYCNLIARSLMKIGVKKGNHVAIWATNCPEWIALQVAVSKIGAILVCINTNYRKHELKYVLNHSETTTLIFSKGVKDHSYLETLLTICPELNKSKPGELNSKELPYLKNLIALDCAGSENIYNWTDFIKFGHDVPEEKLIDLSRTIKPDEVTNLQYTSGTTGSPKAVMTTHFAALNNAKASGQKYQCNDRDRFLLCLPLFHVMGCILSALLCLVNGATIILIDRFRTEKVLQYLAEEKCTGMSGVPTMFEFLLGHKDFSKYNFNALSKGMIAGSNCYAQLVLNIIEKMKMDKLTIVYGQTEGLGITQTLITDPINQRINTVGRALPGVEIKVVNPKTNKEAAINQKGELCVRTVYLMNGYFKNEAATSKAVDAQGWLHTGDLGFKGSDGCFRICGRLKDIIIRGGENISPSEIEELLLAHEKIDNVAIIGVPDEVLGEEIFAFVKLRPSCLMTKEDIILFLKENIAKYKIPKYVQFIKEFPINAAGKIQKFKLKDIAVTQLEELIS